MTTPSTTNNILERLRDKIEDADEDLRVANNKNELNFSHGYDAGYSDALRELWEAITGYHYQPKQ